MKIKLAIVYSSVNFHGDYVETLNEDAFEMNYENDLLFAVNKKTGNEQIIPYTNIRQMERLISVVPTDVAQRGAPKVRETTNGKAKVSK